MCASAGPRAPTTPIVRTLPVVRPPHRVTRAACSTAARAKYAPKAWACAEGSGVSFCAWPDTDPLQCYVDKNIGEDPCAALTTEQDCLAFTSNNELLRCDWITRRLYGAGGASCDPVSETSSCVAVASTQTEPARCKPEAACGGRPRGLLARPRGRHGGDHRNERLRVSPGVVRPLCVRLHRRYSHPRRVRLR